MAISTLFLALFGCAWIVTSIIVLAWVIAVLKRLVVFLDIAIQREKSK